MTWIRKVVWGSAMEAHRWLKKLENPQIIQPEIVGDKVLSTADELLADRAEQWKKLWIKGANKTGETRSAPRRIKQMAIKEAEERMPIETGAVRKARKSWAVAEVWALTGRRTSGRRYCARLCQTHQRLRAGGENTVAAVQVMIVPLIVFYGASRRQELWTGTLGGYVSGTWRHGTLSATLGSNSAVQRRDCAGDGQGSGRHRSAGTLKSSTIPFPSSGIFLATSMQVSPGAQSVKAGRTPHSSNGFVNLGETRNLTEEVTAYASLSGSPPLGYDRM